MDPFSEPTPERKKYALIAGGVFTLLAAGAVFFLTRSDPYPAFKYDRVIDTTLLIIWSCAAAAMFLRRPWTVYFAAVGVFTTLVHGVLVGVSNRWLGLPYLVLFFVLIISWGKSFALFRPMSPAHTAA
jgi:hypothetical protein